MCLCEKNLLNITELGPRDDLESLAYVAFFLLYGNLPWRIYDPNESTKASMQRIHASKAALSGATLGVGFPAEFAYLLDYSRRLRYEQIPDYTELKRQFSDLNRQVEGKDSEGSLDWSAVSVSTLLEHGVSGVAPHEDLSGSDDDFQNDGANEEEHFTNSYFAWDIADWDIQGARDRSLTLTTEQAELADSNTIPRISEVIEVA